MYNTLTGKKCPCKFQYKMGFSKGLNKKWNVRHLKVKKHKHIIYLKKTNYH